MNNLKKIGLSALAGSLVAFVENVAKFIANLRSTELKTIAKQSSKNAEDLFKFDLLSWPRGC